MFTSSEPSAGAVTLAISGEVDIAVAEEVAARAIELLDTHGVSTLTVDLAEVTFLDSSGLGALVRTRNSAEEAGKTVVIANVPASVMKIFTITGLASVFTIEPAPDGAKDG